uniref:AlNc14C349G10899 protein n=1 Tax=Albugo laibachii Nc14 TaxID=890382 RepID=F0WXE8_9STRA|nr:AlNc14C349G10899 [Albugo laibachii Nc14]|eukprot:CCA26140.1 AlNc14C349G10899 [Albugo laibachii Nc14]
MEYTDECKKDLSKPQLLYYVLEEGYLQAYTSHQTAHCRDKEFLVENIVLTAHNIEVERIEDWNVIHMRTLVKKNTTSPGLDTKTTQTEKEAFLFEDEKMVRCPGRLQQNTQCIIEDVSSDIEEIDRESDSMYCFCFHLPFSRKPQKNNRAITLDQQQDDTKQLWLYAAHQDLMNQWVSRILNWNRYVFDFVAVNSNESAKADIFHDAQVLLVRSLIHQASTYITRRKYNRRWPRKSGFLASAASLLSCREHPVTTSCNMNEPTDSDTNSNEESGKLQSG